MRKAIVFGLFLAALVGLARERGPIIILSDQDFTAENGVIAGSGTAGDPYLIAGWTIQVPAGEPFGVRVENTRKHFVLRGCRILGAQHPQGAAIFLHNVANALVEDCFVQDSVNGIRIQSSRDLVVRENFLAVAGVGLQVLGASAEEYRHTIADTNTVNGKPVHYFYGLRDQVLAGLDAGHITLAASQNVVLREPKIVQADGIVVAFSQNVRIEGADISRPRAHGILILASANVVVRDSPRIANSPEAGIAVWLSEDVVVENCGIYANRVGIHVNASDRFVAQNNAFAAGPVGVHISGASQEPLVRKN
ncbi:MAG: right-handed parallel beta-helix repeat-containing protein, partial [Candidatus Bipolaricaulaceae bacterium]